MNTAINRISAIGKIPTVKGKNKSERDTLGSLKNDQRDSKNVTQIGFEIGERFKTTQINIKNI